MIFHVIAWIQQSSVLMLYTLNIRSWFIQESRSCWTNQWTSFQWLQVACSTNHRRKHSTKFPLVSHFTLNFSSIHHSSWLFLKKSHCKGEKSQCVISPFCTKKILTCTCLSNHGIDIQPILLIDLNLSDSWHPCKKVTTKIYVVDKSAFSTLIYSNKNIYQIKKLKQYITNYVIKHDRHLKTQGECRKCKP